MVARIVSRRNIDGPDTVSQSCSPGLSQDCERTVFVTDLSFQIPSAKWASGGWARTLDIAAHDLPPWSRLVGAQRIRLQGIAAGGIRPRPRSSADNTELASAALLPWLRRRDARGGFTASIWLVPKNPAELYVASLQRCRQTNGRGEDESTIPGEWSMISGSVLYTNILGPGCAHDEWHFVAGWLGYPVANLDMSVSTS